MRKIGLGKNLLGENYYTPPEIYDMDPTNAILIGRRIPGYGSFISDVFTKWCKENNITAANLIATLKLMIITGELRVVKQTSETSPNTTRAISVQRGVSVSERSAEGLYTICSPLGYAMNDKYNHDVLLAYMDLVDNVAHSMVDKQKKV